MVAGWVMVGLFIAGSSDWPRSHCRGGNEKHLAEALHCFKERGECIEIGYFPPASLNWPDMSCSGT